MDAFKQPESVVQLLVKMNLITNEDAAAIQTKQRDHILQLMIKKQILIPADREKAKLLLKQIDTTAPLQRMTAQAGLIALITKNLHTRTETASQRIADHTRRVTSGTYAAVIPQLDVK